MNYYQKIKNELVNNEVYKRVKDYSKNRSDLNTYYKVGKLLVEAQGGEERAKYGDGLIKEYSKKLTIDIGKKYSDTNLRYMRQFYIFKEKYHTVCDNLTWGHYRLLIWFEDMNKINYYIKISIEQNLSVRQLREKIKNKEYERLPDNTKNKLITNEEKLNVQDLVKDPIVIKNTGNYEVINEKILKQLTYKNGD